MEVPGPEPKLIPDDHGARARGSADRGRDPGASGRARRVRPWFSTEFARLAHARNRVDRRGYPIHLWCGVLGLCALSSVQSVAEGLFLLPLAACLIRSLATWRSMVDAVSQWPVVWVLAAAAWAALAIAWSPDRWHGFDEWDSARHALVIVAIWALRDHRGLLIGGVAAGLMLGHLTQAGHAIGVWFDVEWLRWPRMADRNSGWWNPVVGGSLATAGVGLHLPGLLWGRGRWRVAAGVGVCVSIAGVVASGTRGAWVASGVLVGVGVAAALAGAWLGSRRAGRGVARSGWVAVGLACVSVVGAAVVAGPAVMSRGSRGLEEVRGVLERGEFASDTGRRLFMWKECWGAWRRTGGVGTGPCGVGGSWSGGDRAGCPLILDHAHGMWPHLAATQDGRCGAVVASAGPGAASRRAGGRAVRWSLAWGIGEPIGTDSRVYGWARVGARRAGAGGDVRLDPGERSDGDDDVRAGGAVRDGRRV